jgi:type II secretory pathway component PulF
MKYRLHLQYKPNQYSLFNGSGEKQNHQKTSHFLNTLLKLLKNGVALPEALTLMAELEQSNKQQTALLEHAHQLRTGIAWDDILKKCPLGWPIDFIDWVKAGLLSSQLIVCLEYYLKTLEEQKILIQKWSKALAYPMTVFMLSIFLSFFIGLELNSSTEKNSLKIYIFITLPLLIFLTQNINRYYRKHQEPENDNEPAWANACKWLSIACSNGISLPQALLKLRETLPAIWNNQMSLGQCFYFLEERLRQGEPLGQAIASSHWPQIMHRSAHLAEVHADLTGFFEQASQVLVLRHENRQEKLLKIWPSIFLGTATLGLLGTYLQYIAPLYEQLSTGGGF